MSQVILYGRLSADPLWPDLGDPQGDGCMKTGISNYQSSDWNGSSAAFEAATKLRPTIGTPWYWLGNVLLRDGPRSHPINI
jgi:hypothetical protein